MTSILNGTSVRLVEPSALDAAVNFALTRVAIDLMNEATGSKCAAENSLDGSASEALAALLRQRTTPAVANNVYREYGFEVALRIAAIVVNNPLGDTRSEVLEAIDDVIARSAEGIAVP